MSVQTKAPEYQPTLGFMIANLDLNLRRLQDMSDNTLDVQRKRKLRTIRAAMATIRAELDALQ